MDRAVIVLVMMLALAGSILGSVALWAQDAPWWQIALGYVGGGWAGLLLGLPVILAGRWLWRCVPRRPAPTAARPKAPVETQARCRPHR